MSANFCSRSVDFGCALARAHPWAFEFRSRSAQMSARSERRSIERRSLKLCKQEEEVAKQYRQKEQQKIAEEQGIANSVKFWYFCMYYS